MPGPVIHHLEVSAPDLKAAFRVYCQERDIPDPAAEWERFWALLGEYTVVKTRQTGDKVRL